MKVGRPSDYTKWKARAICMRIADGESLRSICNRKYYPSRYAVFRWLESNKEFRNQYAQAREMQQEHFYDEMFEIADDASNDWMLKHGKADEEYWALNGEHVQRSRIRIDTRKWVMERMSPRRYGAKKSIDHTSSDGSMSPDGMTQEERKNRINELLNKNAGG